MQHALIPRSLDLALLGTKELSNDGEKAGGRTAKDADEIPILHLIISVGPNILRGMASEQLLCATDIVDSFQTSKDQVILQNSSDG